jgi:hypothetical protein
MESAKKERAESEAVEQKSTMLTVQVLWACHAFNASPEEAAQQVVADLFEQLSKGGSVSVHVEELGGKEHTIEVTANTRNLWGDTLDSVRVFFDDVRAIPTWNQRGKLCAVCRGQATYVKLDLLDRPLAFYCDRDVFEARRGAGTEALSHPRAR